MELDLAAAQPAFSDNELTALFRALKLPGDPHNAADRARAMAQLSDALADPARTREVVAALDEVAEVDDGGPVLAAHTAQWAATPKPITAADWALMEDAPTTGRVLNALHQRGHIPDPLHDDDALSAHLTGGCFHFRRPGRVSAEYRRAHSLLLSATPELASMHHFLIQACEALPDRSPSFIARLWEWIASLPELIKNEVTESTWRTGPDGVDVQLRHGARTWYVALKFHGEAVRVQVSNEQLTVIEREVAKTQPADLSQTLLDALNGDLRSTHLALDAVQRAVAAEAQSVH